MARGFLPTWSGGRGEAETGRQQADPFKKRVRIISTEKIFIAPQNKNWPKMGDSGGIKTCVKKISYA